MGRKSGINITMKNVLQVPKSDLWEPTRWGLPVEIEDELPEQLLAFWARYRDCF